MTPFLCLSGADRAIDFYKKAFGAQERFRMPTPDGKVARTPSSRSVIPSSCSPRHPGAGHVGERNLYVPNADATFDRAVKAGAQSTMPLADMFWGDRYGRLTDPFGVRWGIATHKEDVPPEEMGRRAAKAMG